MVPKIKLFLFIILIISSLHTAKGEDVKTSDLDSVKLSLLTCAPGDAIYTLLDTQRFVMKILPKRLTSYLITVYLISTNQTLFGDFR